MLGPFFTACIPLFEPLLTNLEGHTTLCTLFYLDYDLWYQKGFL